MKHSSDHSWRREHSEAGPNLKLFRVRFDDMRNPRNGKTARMIVLESNDSVNVVALTPREEVLFVRQYRFGTQAYTLELPGGLVDDKEDNQRAVSRELREETGYSTVSWQYLGRIASNPVFMDSHIHHWLARDVERTHDLQLDDAEEVELVLLPLAEVRRRFFAGTFDHPHTVNGLLRFFALENKL